MKSNVNKKADLESAFLYRVDYSMKFLLYRNVLEPHRKVEIDQNKFSELKRAREGLFQILAIEEKYDLVIRNYLSFEKVINDTSLHGLMITDRSWSDFMEHIQSANLVIMNLLSICRSYIDHLPQHLSCVFLDSSPSIIDSFHTKRRDVYNDFLGYRTLYALRNHVQHSGLPVQSFTMSGAWVDGRAACSHSAVPFLSVTELDKDKSIKKDIIKELKEIGDKIDLRLLVRQNMSAFSTVHKFVRELIETQTKTWDKVIEENISVFTQQTGEKPIGLSAFNIDDHENVLEEFSLFEDMIKRREYLESKNRCITNVEKHFITGQINYR